MAVEKNPLDNGTYQGLIIALNTSGRPSGPQVKSFLGPQRILFTSPMLIQYWMASRDALFSPTQAYKQDGNYTTYDRRVTDTETESPKTRSMPPLTSRKTSSLVQKNWPDVGVPQRVRYVLSTSEEGALQRMPPPQTKAVNSVVNAGSELCSRWESEETIRALAFEALATAQADSTTVPPCMLVGSGLPRCSCRPTEAALQIHNSRQFLRDWMGRERRAEGGHSASELCYRTIITSPVSSLPNHAGQDWVTSPGCSGTLTGPCLRQASTRSGHARLTSTATSSQGPFARAVVRFSVLSTEHGGQAPEHCNPILFMEAASQWQFGTGRAAGP